MKISQSVLALSLFIFVASDGFGQSAKPSSISQAVGSDIKLMNKARIFFEKGKLDESYSTYESIPKSSDFWLEAMEEKAHVMGRKKDYAKALALLQTPMSSAFVGLVGPEPYFVAALTYLKICDYSAVFKITKLFKERFQDRVAALSQIEKTRESSALNEVLKKMQGQELSFQTAGTSAKDLPRNMHRDRIVSNLAAQKSTAARDASIKLRVSQLAKRELKEIEDIVNKLQVIEAEVIHRIYLADKDNSRREKQGQIAGGKNMLTFPYTGEVWLDELDSYAARVEKCPDTIRRAAL